MVFTRSFISKSFKPFTNTLWSVPSTPITICITFTLMFYSYLCSLAMSRYLSFFPLSFNFTLWSAGTAKSTIGLVWCYPLPVFPSIYRFSFLRAFWFFLVLVVLYILSCVISHILLFARWIFLRQHLDISFIFSLSLVFHSVVWRNVNIYLFLLITTRSGLLFWIGGFICIPKFQILFLHLLL